MRQVVLGLFLAVVVQCGLAGGALAQGDFKLASWLSPREPTPGAPPPDTSSPFKARPNTPVANPWSIGIRSGYTTVPNAILGGFFDKYMPVNGYFFEAVVGRKIRGFTLYTGLTATRAQADRGIWQRNLNKLPDEISMDFTVLSVEALFDWEVRLHPRFAFHFGAGLGIGGLIGSISSQQCTQINNTGSCAFIPGAPTKDKASEGIPLYPILHLVAGTRIQLVDKLALTVDFDFRDAFGIAFGIFYAL